MGKNLKIYIYICRAESLFCTPESNTTLYINYTSIRKQQQKSSHLFLCLWAIYVSSPVNYVFVTFAYFSLWLVNF